ncbi:Serpin I2, partial [Dufourea novaeangliae]
ISGYVYVAIVYILTLTTERCSSEMTKVLNNSNTTKDIVPEIVNRNEDNEDFVPYRGESFSTFDWMLFRTMSKKHPGNLVLSPISLKIALVLLYEGAQGESEYELASTMQLPVTRPATRDRFTTILRSLQTRSPAYTLNIGTRIYIDSNILVRQLYQAIVKQFYATDVITTNLSETRPLIENINGWVSNITDGNIDKMIENESGVKDSLMIITNAVFFKGSWRRKYFSPKNTQTGSFYTNLNRTVQVPFMQTTDRFYFSESTELDAKILRIPYDGDKFAMYFILPRTRTGIEQLANEINPSVLMRHGWQLEELEVDVSIPKFKFEYSSHMESVLRELGIRDIFDDTATLTRIAFTKRTSRRLKVSDILQKVGIEVNENGTMAYAATEVHLGNKIQDKTFYATHPFLFYIEDELTGTILYMGKITNPIDTSENQINEGPDLGSKSETGIPNADSGLQVGLNADDRDNLFSTHFSQTLNNDHNGNLISSPASVKAALTLLAEAANGDTKTELMSVLRLPDHESRVREVTQRALTSLKRNDNGTEIDLSICLWTDKNLNILDRYEQVLRLYYKAIIKSVNFVDSKNTARVINDWVRQAARDQISSPLVTHIRPDTRLLLTSVIYFKGSWLKAFDKAKTRLECFYVLNGECRNTSFMTHTSTYRYAYIPAIEAEILDIPYSNGRTSMLTIIPSKRERDPYLRILSRDLATVPVSAIIASLKETRITIHLPKFSIENSLDLVPTLQHLGIESIFRDTTNLTEVISRSAALQVTSILQNVRIKVDEDGTLAAADTEIGFVPLSSWDNDIKLDRPFLFLIVDSVTNTMLFSGRFMEPF